MSLRNSLTGHHYPSAGFQQIPESQAGDRNANLNIPMQPVNRTDSNKTVGSRRAGERSPGLAGAPINQYNEKRVHPRPGHSRRNTGLTGGDGAVNYMGKIYDAIKNFSIVTRYLLYVIPVGLVLLVPIIVLSFKSVAWNNDKNDWIRWGRVRILWVFVWIEIFWCALWASKLAAKALPAVFQFLCGIVSPGVRKYKSVLKRLEIPISLVIWFGVSIITFINVIAIDALRDPATPPDPKNPPKSPDDLHTHNFNDIPWASTFNKVLLAFLISSAVFLAEQFIIQLISISYHHTQYEHKIKQSKQNIDILTLLYEASCSLFPAYCNEFAEEDYIINDSIELPKGLGGGAGSRGGNGRPKSGTATPMRLIQNVGRLGDKVTAVFGNIASEVTGKQVFNPMAGHNIVVEALEKRRSCEALARRIWMSLVVEGRDALYLDDIQEVLAGHGHYSAEDVFAAIDTDGNSDVSLDEMIMVVTNFGRERKSIATSLHDVDQAIRVLDRLLLFLVLIVCIFIFIIVLSPSFTTSIAGVGASLLSLSFVFAVTTQEILGSCIFLFVKHPYDVGDRVDINGQFLTVMRISLLYTVFRNINTGKSTQAPNIVLNTLWVDNVSRSDAMKEQITMNIDFSTTIEDIELLRQEINKFVNDKDNSRDFQPDVLVEVTSVNDMNKLELKVEIKHKSNWHNETLRAARRSKFMCALVLALRKVPINPPGGSDAALGSADQPSWSVAISPEAAKEARQAYKDEKEAKKLINDKDASFSSGSDTHVLSPETSLRSRKGAEPTSGSQANAETEALTKLNSRTPGFDDFDSGKGTAGLSPGRPAVEHSKSPVHPDGQRMNELNDLYGDLTKTTSGGRRQSYSMHVTHASPVTPAPPAQEHSMLMRSNDSSPTDEMFSGDRAEGSRARSGSPSGRAYSPLEHPKFDQHDFDQPGWGNGNFMGSPSPAQPANLQPPAPSQSRYVTPPAKAEEPTPKMSATAGPGSPGESWFDRDSAAYPSGDMDYLVSSGSPQPPHAPRESRGPPSARASSFALASLPENAKGAPAVPKEPMPKAPSPMKSASRAQSQKGVSRGQSQKSDMSWGRGDEDHFA